MIKTRSDLFSYIREDMNSNNVKMGGIKNNLLIWLNPRLRFTKNLRQLEYHTNNKGLWHKVMRLWHYYIHKKLSYKLGYTIYPNTFGPGVCFCHYGTLVVNKAAKIGKNCRIHVGVNIGNQNGTPMIGDNVYIGPGVKMFGPITIGNNVTIGANAVVNKSFPDNVVIAGVPAKIIKEKNE